VTETNEHARRIFSFAEARVLLPEIRKITEIACERVEELRREAEQGGDAQRLETEAKLVVQVWASALQERGVEVKGLWLADFDNGSGYYCWRWPETALEYYHSYEDGFRGRMRIQ
jgi:hypothetical protein